MSLPTAVCSALNGYRQKLNFAILGTFGPLKGYFESLPLNGYADWVQNRITTATNRISSIEEFIQNNSCQISLLQTQNPNPHPNNPIIALSSIKKSLNFLADEALDMFFLPDTQEYYPAAIYIRGLVEEQTEEESTTSELLKRSIVAFILNNPPKFGLGQIDATLP